MVSLPSRYGIHMSELTQSTTPSNHIEVAADVGSGRTFVTIIDDRRYLPLAKAVVEQLGTRARSILLLSEAVSAESWSALSQVFADTLLALNVRQVSLVGVGAGATLAQNLALSNPKAVRILAIVDASSRPHPSSWERAVDWLEERLPFGLPLRLGSQGFNVKAYLHRLRCPLLAITSGSASQFVREEMRTLAARAPTAWAIELRGNEAEQLSELTAALLSFQDTPAKCPQKNMKEAV